MLDALRTRTWGLVAVLALALLVANLVAQPEFGSPSNWPEELAALAPFALIALASTPSILSGGGGIDISVGPIAVLINVVLVKWLLPHGGLDGWWLDIPLALALGAAVGTINGVLVAVLRFQPVIATLCTFFVLSGLVLKIAPDVTRPPEVAWLNHVGDTVGPIPGALVLLLVPLVLWLALQRTAFHDNLYAVGDNTGAAFSAGVQVVRVRVAAYALGGLFAGLGGVALTALVQSTQTAQVTEYTLIALAAVALGGTSFAGGRGGLVSSLLGAFCIYLLQVLLGAVNVSATWLDVVYGGALICGVIAGASLGRMGRRVVVT